MIKTFNKWFWFSIGGFTLLIVIICFLPYLITNNYWFGIDFNETGPIGDTIGGLMGPFVAIAAAVLTFLAFWVQYQSNNEQRQQFEKLNQDQLFFKLLDAQESKIINSSFTKDNQEFKSYQLLEYIIKQFEDEMIEFSKKFARILLQTNYRKINSMYYDQMFEQKLIKIEFWDEKREEFFSQMDSRNENERWEYLKHYFNSLGSEGRKQAELLVKIGSVYFYKVEYNEHKFVYQETYHEIEKRFGSFLDGYFKGWEFIAVFVEDNINKSTYSKYLYYQSSKYEKIMLFYFIASGMASQRLVKFIKDNDILNDLHKYNTLLIDMPSKEEIAAELCYIYKSYSLD